LRVLEVSLRKAGYSVATCADVDAALELIGLSEPDLVIADTRLTGKDGFALARELRARATTAQLPFLFLSSDPSVEAKVKSLEIGIEDYLTKPVYMREILTRVNLIMERSEREGLGRTAKTRFSGSLEDMGLVDLLQTIEVSRKSGVLKLSFGQRRGTVTFMEGRVIDAELGNLSGEAAIYRFLLWSEGAFELEFRDVRGEDKLGISTQAILMEGVRRLDEWGRLQEQLPGLHAVLEVNHAELALRLGEVPDELNGVLRCFDGQRDLIQVIETCGGDDLATLTAISKLFFDGFLSVRHRTDPSEARVGGGSDPFIGYVPTESQPPHSDNKPTPPVHMAPDDERISALPVGERTDPSDVTRASLPAAQVSLSQPAMTSAGRVPLAVLRLKRVSAINQSLRPQNVTRDIGGDVTETEQSDASTATQVVEGEDDMAKRNRKEREQDRTGGTVIPLHAVRGEPAQLEAPPNVAVSPPRDDAVRAAEQLATDDDHDEVHTFFSTAEKASQPPPEHWGDLDAGDGEHDHDHERLHGQRKSAMLWTGVIAGVGLMLISAFLIYHKVLMPTPEELAPGPVSLPTPDMLQGTRPALEPEPPSNVAPAPTAPGPSAPAPNGQAPEAPAQPAPVQQAPMQQPMMAPANEAAPPRGAALADVSAQAPQALPADPEFEAQLAKARKLGHARGAEAAYLAALKLRPTSSQALSGLALLYLDQSKNEQARERAQQATGADPNNDEGWIVLGAAEDALGRRSQARTAYEKCAALPSGKYVGECRRMVR
jgi:CheY-like chemotaxis protein